MLVMYYNDDSTAVVASPATMTTGLGGDSAFVRFLNVDVDGADAIEVRYATTGDGHEIAFVLDSAHHDAVWSREIGSTDGAFVTDTFRLGAELSGVRDVHLMYRGPGGSDEGSFALDYFGLGDFGALVGTADAALAADAFAVYPNPATASVRVDVAEAATVELLDVSGRRVTAPRALGAGQHADLATDGLARGVYVVRVVAGQRVGHRQLVLR